MCCQEHRAHHGHGCGCGCGCGGHHGVEGFQRRFPTKAERIAELKEYLEALRAEAKGVEEQIAKLEKEQ